MTITNRLLIDMIKYLEDHVVETIASGEMNITGICDAFIDAHHNGDHGRTSDGRIPWQDLNTILKGLVKLKVFKLDGTGEFARPGKLSPYHPDHQPVDWDNRDMRTNKWITEFHMVRIYALEFYRQYMFGDK